MAPHQSKKNTPSPDEAIRITVDGETWELDLMDANHVDRLELWRQSHLTIPMIIGAMQAGEADTFFVAALVFLARRQANQPATFDAIAESIGWDSDIDVQVGAPTAPEAPAAD